MLDELSVPSGDVNLGLLAQSDSESPANTSDGSDGVRSQSLSVQVRVQDTDDETEVSRLIQVQLSALGDDMTTIFFNLD